MKKFISLLLTASAFLQGAAQQAATHHNDLYFDNLNGHVEKVTEMPYAVDRNDKIGAENSCCVSILAYDKRGYRTMDVSEDAFGKGRSGQVYTKRYANGHVKEIQFMANGKVVSTLVGTPTKEGDYGTARIYDEAGRLVSYINDVKVNSYGKVIYMNRYKPDNTLQQTVINIYQDQIWVGGSIKDSSGAELFSTSITLDKKRNPLEVVQTQLIAGHISVTRKKYVYDRFDGFGNWIQRRELNDKGEVRKLVKREIRYRK